VLNTVAVRPAAGERKRMRLFGTALAAATVLAAGPAGAQGRVVDLPATAQTVIWGRYDAQAKPAIRIRSGDTVVIHTLLTNSPSGLEHAGVAAAEVEPALRDVFDHVPQAERGPGGHVLTGPVYVEGAQPGDVLEVRIRKIDLAIPYAYNGFRYGLGLLTDDYPYSRTKIVRLDRASMTAPFAPGVVIPLHPFFGSMGVAPPAGWGRYDSTAPSLMGGNMDDKSLVEGTTLYFPVFAPGGLFEVGDGHAAQGDGEIDVTALETSLTGTFQFIVRHDMHIDAPRAETPTEYVSMGFDDDLAVATRKAAREMVGFLQARAGLSRDDAYALASSAADLHITEIVDRNKGVHMAIPKAIFTAAAPASQAGSAR
jgi:acetamidase/formamidase